MQLVVVHPVSPLLPSIMSDFLLCLLSPYYYIYHIYYPLVALIIAHCTSPGDPCNEHQVGEYGGVGPQGGPVADAEHAGAEVQLWGLGAAGQALRGRVSAGGVAALQDKLYVVG